MKSLSITVFFGVSALLASAAQFPSQAQNHTAGDKWQPHIDLEGKPGTKRSLAETDLFLPLWQDDDTLLFGSFRLRMDDSDSREGNFGVGLRQMLDNGWNLGGYGYFDHRKSPYDNSFNQATLGIEALSLDWDLRANAYLPFGRTAHLADEFAEADFSGTNIQYRAGYERAMKGFDAEIGWRAPVFDDDANQQLRIYGGGYRFTDDYAKTVQGPRGRIDLTFDETPYLWAGSRLSVGAEIQHDKPRGTQSFALLRLRIPLQNFDEKSKRRSLSAMERRMADPIIRDVDIVSQIGAFGPSEKITQTADGNSISIFVDPKNNGADLSNAVTAAGANATIVLTGTIDVGQHVTLQSGQTIMGKGDLQVKTPSGRTVTVSAPGATITGDGSSVLARSTMFVMSNNSRLIGMTIDQTVATNTAFSVGVLVNGANNVEITGNTIKSEANNNDSAAIRIVGGASNTQISNNKLTANMTTGGSAAAYGLLLDTTTNTTFENNTVTVTNAGTNRLVSYTGTNSTSGSNNIGNVTLCQGTATTGSVSFTNGTSC